MQTVTPIISGMSLLCTASTIRAPTPLMEKMLSVIEKMPKSLFNGERFLTDEELSKVLRVSRRTLQEYRTFGVVPYYMVQGKTLYKESDILKILEDSYKRCREEQRWV